MIIRHFPSIITLEKRKGVDLNDYELLLHDY